MRKSRKIDLTNEQIRDLYQGIIALPKSNVEVDVQVQLELTIMAGAFKGIYDGLIASSRLNGDAGKRYDEYSAESEALARKYAAPNSFMLSSPGVFTFTLSDENTKAYNKEENIINKKYDDVIKLHEKHDKEYKDLLKEQRKVKVVDLQTSDVKGSLKDPLSKMVVNSLFPLMSDVNRDYGEEK